MENGEHGLHGGLAALYVVVELKTGLESVTAQHPTMEELLVQDQRQKSKAVQIKHVKLPKMDM